MVSYAGAARRLVPLSAIACAINSSTSFVTAASDPTGSGWRSDLNWKELESQLSPSASLIDTSYANYRDECFPEFFEISASESSTHALIDQPAGMCLPHLFLGWKDMYPRPSDNGHLNTTLMQGFQDLGPVGAGQLNEEMMGWLNDESNPSLNLPYKVLFPSVASDVVAAIEFAKEHDLEISVKNSGHSYSGASSKKDTLLLNMNRYTHYAPGGITDCDPALLGTAIADDLSNQACLLSLAKNKSSLIRVGGGENWDKTYRAVIAANQALEEYKYHVLGGAPTVSPNGWTFQGGLGGFMGSRLYGLGADQVLQIEMVLPNAYHVKFGPTEWEDASENGFIVPRTTLVSGVCRSNPDEQDEEKWIWEECPEDFDIDFGDLWYAVRGGGGGSWGVVTSMSLQLHDYLPFTEFGMSLSEECSALRLKFLEFRAKYMMAPQLLNVTKEMSHACGDSGSGGFFCYGENAILQAWAKFLEQDNSTDPTATEACFFINDVPKSFAEHNLGSNPRFPGKVNSDRVDFLGETFGGVLVPQSWLDEDSEENIKTLLGFQQARLYTSFGGATVSASDQADSVSKAHRNAAVIVMNLLGQTPASIQSFWSDLFPKMFDISDKTKFPPVFGSNHAGPLLSGPLKEDWTKACPLDWTFAERIEKCISSQEAIYGTETLSRLETIKKAVDPNFMFNCNLCIRNNLDLAKASHSQDDGDELESSQTGAQSDEPSGASHAPTYVALIVAAVFHLFLFIVNQIK